MRIAAILTCHNRRDKTLACLRALYACERQSGCELDTYLVDDGSTDGTGAAVRAKYPLVTVIAGDGSLYWNGGMRLAFGTAMRHDYDAYLWLNDDTLLYRQTLRNLLYCAEEVAANHDGRHNIIVGATCDPVSRRITYGGMVSHSRWAPNSYVLLPPSKRTQQCQSMNGNCVLIPREVVQAIGNIDAGFVHAIGDWDYGLRARHAGFGIWMAPGFAGECSVDLPGAIPAREQASVRHQLRRICGPKGVPPHAWGVYVRRHCGLFWPAYFVRPYIGAVMRALHAKLRLALGGQVSC